VNDDQENGLNSDAKCFIQRMLSLHFYAERRYAECHYAQRRSTALRVLPKAFLVTKL
jgi:hypothetical protein